MLIELTLETHINPCIEEPPIIAERRESGIRENTGEGSRPNIFNAFAGWARINVEQIIGTHCKRHIFHDILIDIQIG